MQASPIYGDYKQIKVPSQGCAGPVCKQVKQERAMAEAIGRDVLYKKQIVHV